MASNKIDYFGLKTFSEKLVKKIDINTKEKDGLVPATKGQVQPHIYATNENGQPGWIPSNLVQTQIPNELLSVINGPSNNASYKIWGTNDQGIPGWMPYSNNNSEDQFNPIDIRIYNDVWQYWRNDDSASQNANIRREFYFLEVDPISLTKTDENYNVCPESWSFKYSVKIEVPYIPYNPNIDSFFAGKNFISDSTIEVNGLMQQITDIKVKTMTFDKNSEQIIFPDKNNEGGDVYSSLFSYHVRITGENYHRCFGISFLNNIDTYINQYWSGGNPFAINYENAKKRVTVKLLAVNNCRVNLFNRLQYANDGYGYFGQDYQIPVPTNLSTFENYYTRFADNSIGEFDCKDQNFYHIYSKVGRHENASNGTYVNITGSNVEIFKASSSNKPGAIGLVPAPAVGDQTKFLRGDGTWATPPTSANTTYAVMSGATSSSAGKSGLVPTPAAGDQVKFLRGDGTWVELTEFTSATSSQDGVAGFVPAPSSTWYNTQANRFLRADGAWSYHPYAPSSTNYSFVPKAISGTTNLTTSAYVLTGAGWKAFTAFDNVQPATAAAGTTPGAHGVKGLVPAPNSAWFSTGAQDPNLIYLAGTGTWKWTNNFISDNLTDTSTYKALSARMGNALAGRFDSSYTVDANSTVSIPIRVNCRALLITVGSNVNTLGLYILWTNASGVGVIKTITAHTTLTLDLSTAKQLKATAGSAGCRFYFINLSGNNNIHEV